MTGNNVNNNIEQIDKAVESENKDIDSILKSKASYKLDNFRNISINDFLFEYITESEQIASVFNNAGDVVSLVGKKSCNKAETDLNFGVGGVLLGGPPRQSSNLPPITNRGASKYQNTIPPNDVKSSNKSEVNDDIEVKQLQRGGYDGGVEIGFEGRYLDGIAFLLERLENAKQKAAENSCSYPLEICGRDVLVECSGANAGLHYKYVFTLDGIKFLLHHNPPKDRQAIRVRYGATSLIGRNLFTVHQEILKFLQEIGFVVSRECLSRVDLQVLIEAPIDSFIGLIFSGHAISKSRKDVFHRDCGQVETYTLGNAGRIQLCIYDKRKEISHALCSDPVKFELFLRYCFGFDLYSSQNPITRVEFRLWRDVLREIGIDTVSDLYLRENDLVKWLTHDWFRILSSPKIRGHENTASVHPLWLRVRDLFDFWFSNAKRESGELYESQAIDFNRSERISCNPDMLERQGFGCLSKALAFRYGIQGKIDLFKSMLSSYLQDRVGLLFHRVNDNAKRIEIMKGVVLGENDQQESTCKNYGVTYNEYDCFVRPDRKVWV
ncbi:MAG: hypothetical protein LBP59_01655 [Planctomycetaceae bacterium]|jgi:hypothetical protein|nr:hypothetical protein [Planctomycetaceae bacterium]